MSIPASNELLVSEDVKSFEQPSFVLGKSIVASIDDNSQVFRLNMNENGELQVDFEKPVNWSWVIRKIANEFPKLREGWDSYYGKPISKKTIKFTLETIARTFTENTPEPSNVVPGANGGIQIEWHMKDRDLEVEFTPDNRVIILLELYNDDKEIELDLTEDISQLRSIISNLI